jgi:apolipoprotein N-acyltransferase
VSRSPWLNLARTLSIHCSVFVIMLVAGAFYSIYLLPNGHLANEVFVALALIFLLYLATYTLIQIVRRKRPHRGGGTK